MKYNFFYMNLKFTKQFEFISLMKYFNNIFIKYNIKNTKGIFKINLNIYLLKFNAIEVVYFANFL